MKKKDLWISVLVAIFCTAGIAAATQLTSSSQFPTAATNRPNQLTVIGCVQRSAQTTAGTTGNASFAIKDFRAGNYRLDGDQNLLTFHVGHEVEIKGTIIEPETKNAAPKLKVASLVYLSPSCRKQ